MQVNINQENNEGSDAGDGRKSDLEATYRQNLITTYDKKSLYIFKEEWLLRQLVIRMVDSR